MENYNKICLILDHAELQLELLCIRLKMLRALDCILQMRCVFAWTVCTLYIGWIVIFFYFLSNLCCNFSIQVELHQKRCKRKYNVNLVFTAIFPPRTRRDKLFMLRNECNTRLAEWNPELTCSASCDEMEADREILGEYVSPVRSKVKVPIPGQ